MNGLLKLKDTTPICGLIPFKYLLYSALISDIVSSPVYGEGEDSYQYALSAYTQEDVFDYYSDHWDVEVALNELCEEGLVLFFEDDGNIAVGEMRGRKFFPFERKSSLFDSALDFYKDSVKRYGSSKSAKDRSRASYISEQVNRFLDKGVANMNASDFTTLHGYLFEIYTGGEIYMIRSRTEYFQTNNMLKAYDRHTVFALLVEGTLNYDKYRNRGMPTLTTVACMKDDVFSALTTKGKGSKDYMRNVEKSMDSEF